MRILPGMKAEPPQNQPGNRKNGTKGVKFEKNRFHAFFCKKMLAMKKKVCYYVKAVA